MKLYLLAGEPSGDKLGAALIRGLKALNPDIDLRGVAGPLMQAEGMQSLFPMSDLSVMGIAEVLPKYPALLRRLGETAEDAVAWQPDALITIDSPDFSLRLAKRVKRAVPLTRTIHYVAPSVWAWRPGRAAKMARDIDHVLALLPFEPPYMEAEGMRCDFVGHPVVAEPVATDEEIESFQCDVGAPYVLALPGSRKSEVKRHADVFGAALAKFIEQSGTDTRVVIPAASGLDQIVADLTSSWPGRPAIVPSTELARKRAAFRGARVAIAASGTVSLELAASDTPMVVAYDMNWLSWQIMSRKALIDTVTLVNLISETRAVDEFLGPACKPGPIADAMVRLVSDKERMVQQSQARSKTMDLLGQGEEHPGLRAARAVLDGLSA